LKGRPHQRCGPGGAGADGGARPLVGPSISSATPASGRSRQPRSGPRRPGGPAMRCR
jgi:hypothetical protein